MIDLLKKAYELHITLPYDTLGAVATISPDISVAVFTGKQVNRKEEVLGNVVNGKLLQTTWQQSSNVGITKGLVTNLNTGARYHPDLPKGRKSDSGNDRGSK